MTPPLPTPADAARFWSKVDRASSCWLWLGSTRDRRGYGQFHLHGSMRFAHRVAFCIAHNRWPTLDLMHTCDTPRCVNPDHLREATPRENNEDKHRKGRHAHRLTQEQVLSIYHAARHTNTTYADIADQHGITTAQVHHIATGKTWKHLGLAPTHRYRMRDRS